MGLIFKGKENVVLFYQFYLWELFCRIEIYVDKHIIMEKYSMIQANKRVLNS